MNKKHLDIVFQKTLDELNHKTKQEDKEKQIKGHIEGTIGHNLYVLTRKSYKFKGSDILLIYLNDCLQILKCHNGMDIEYYTYLNKEKYRPLAYAIPFTSITLSNLKIQLRDNNL
jgi:hypothetical protein